MSTRGFKGFGGYLGDSWRKFGAHLDEFWRTIVRKREEIKRRLEVKNLVFKTICFDILII